MRCCSWMNDGCLRWLNVGRIARGLLAALSACVLVASGSVVKSFEPSQDDQGKPAAKSADHKPGPNSKKAAAGEKAGKGKAARKNAQNGDEAAAAGPKGPLPQRPARTITAPTLTSAELDRMIAKHLAQNNPKVEPSALTSDVEFVRRIYFDVNGRPPTPIQVDSFLRDRTKDKRARLIDSLLGSPDYARNWANYWREVIMFHATSDNLGRVRVDELENWMAKRLQANTSWDVIVSGLITAMGRPDENGAVAFALAHETRPIELAGETSRIFMGVQIQCAQCHDHKTDAWKRRQFHEFAAFFTGVGIKPVGVREKGQPPVIEVGLKGSRRYMMPEMDNPAKQIPIAPRFFLAGSKSNPAPALPEGLAVAERRAMAASYITGQDNPWFARSFINRVWYVLMGETFYEPVDDIGPERTSKAPEVLDPLAEQWQKGGYDIRWLFSTILNTEAYQRRVRSTASAAGKTPFASSCPSRLRADQVFDALVQALAIPLDAEGKVVPGPGQGQGVMKAQARVAKGFPNNPGTLSLSDPRRSSGEPLKKGGVQKAVQAAGLPSQVPKKGGAAMKGGDLRLRFDRLFTVDPSGANEDVMGTIPQALFLMNDPRVNNRIQARPGTVLGEILNTAPNNRAALGALYVRVLSRQPTKDEVEVCGRYMSAVGNQAEAFEDIYWSLINSTEFLTRR
jgi:uncharacterized protein DUF1549/uncharacterized protein DUF1553